MKQYIVIGKNCRAYWYFMYDCSAAAILQPGCVFESIEEAERVFGKALGDDDAEEVTLYEIDEDGNTRILADVLSKKASNHMTSSMLPIEEVKK